MQAIAYTLQMNLEALMTYVSLTQHHSNRSCAVLESPGSAALIDSTLHVEFPVQPTRVAARLLHSLRRLASS